MVMAWTYLLHSYYRSKRVDYRYYTTGPKRKRYDRTKRGAHKYWELERCLNETSCRLTDTQPTTFASLSACGMRSNTK